MGVLLSEKLPSPDEADQWPRNSSRIADPSPGLVGKRGHCEFLCPALSGREVATSSEFRQASELSRCPDASVA